MKNLKTWKSISATLLAATLVTSTSAQVFANETEKVEAPAFETVNLQEALENVKEENVSSADLEVISSVIPVGYLANNIFALSMNLEKISNPKAKEALRKNIERAIARWEAKQKLEDPIIETPEDEVATIPEDEATEVPETEEEVVETPSLETEATEETEDAEEAEGTEETELETPDVVTDEEKEEDAEKAEYEAKKAEKLAKAEAKKAAELEKAAARKAKHESKHEDRKVKHENKREDHKAKHENKGENGHNGHKGNKDKE